MLRHHAELRALVLIFRNYRARRPEFLGVRGRKLERTFRQFATFEKRIMLLCIQQIASSRMLNNEPVVQSDIVIGSEFQASCGHAV